MNMNNTCSQGLRLLTLALVSLAPPVRAETGESGYLGDLPVVLSATRLSQAAADAPAGSPSWPGPPAWARRRLQGG